MISMSSRTMNLTIRTVASPAVVLSRLCIFCESYLLNVCSSMFSSLSFAFFSALMGSLVGEYRIDLHKATVTSFVFFEEGRELCVVLRGRLWIIKRWMTEKLGMEVRWREVIWGIKLLSFTDVLGVRFLHNSSSVNIYYYEQ